MLFPTGRETYNHNSRVQNPSRFAVLCNCFTTAYDFPLPGVPNTRLARIQTLMLQKDIEQLSDPNFILDGSSTVYVIFMIIGIVGYFTVPTVAGWIVSAGGTTAYNRNLTRAGALTGAAGAATGKIAGKLFK